jgi:GT2 family glycosyltransferase
VHSIVVPFHRNLGHLERCLAAVAAASPGGEIIVAADAAPDDPAAVAARHGAVVVSLDGPQGPATARNRGAAVARGEVLVFVDSDVVVHDDAIRRICDTLKQHPEVAAVFGAYDDRPEAPGAVSRCKNLSHAFIHRRSSTEATTFWAGLGAVRASAFRHVGGFDERFSRPSVEDIDLGYRLTAAGYRIRLDPAIQGTHLKRWTIWTAIRTDLRDRGIPWTQLLHRYGGMRNDLNLTWKYRSAVVLAYLALVALAAAFWHPAFLLVGMGLLATIAWLDRAQYAFLMRYGGVGTAACWFPLHVAHHIGNGIAYAAGSALHLTAGWRWAQHAGALPVTAWHPSGAAPRARNSPGGWNPGVGLDEGEPTEPRR